MPMYFQLDKKVITKIAKGELEEDESIIKHTCCDKVMMNVTSLQNVTTVVGGANVTQLQNVTEWKEVNVNCDWCK